MLFRSLDEVQANFVAEIKLRNINREYILKRTAETDALEKDIADLEATLESKRRIRGIITYWDAGLSVRFRRPENTLSKFPDAKTSLNGSMNLNLVS